MADVIPFDQRDGSLWFDGKLVPWKDAKAHVLTHGLHYASCVFEGERMYNGRIYKLKEHTHRLFESARILGITIPFTEDEISAACIEACEVQGYKDAYVRPVVYRGSEMMAVSAQSTKTHVAIAAWQWPSYFDPETKMKGIRLDVSDWKRPAPDTAPTQAKAAGLYMICTMSKHAAEAKGYADAMMLDYRGYVAEATGANIFFVKGGTLYTPPADCFLNGITRQSVIALAKLHQIPVVERLIRTDELPTFTECFLTGSAAEVTPVSEIGPWKFTPGDICRKLMTVYSEDVNAEVSVVKL
ncbi:branched-chain amino acid aminotransferase [Rhizomicrobium palustre]|uniref:Branched-chain-amino-acid aminotransferase n=1 Tax=Rhizomicrobium palustre TaxID=189966 RepID=A0A846MXN0_9PROT|nr:branched-chain amino acid aminotransferase [Rhizomicrobium palustre]NIK87737.1 branched-chain amino acid aminotransferase [Rhizomicrobium palustre]